MNKFIFILSLLFSRHTINAELNYLRLLILNVEREIKKQAQNLLINK